MNTEENGARFLGSFNKQGYTYQYENKKCQEQR